MYHNLLMHARDFVVYWKTACFVRAGGPVYSVARDGAWVFKYPPWTFPLFLPFGFLDLTWAKTVYGILQVLAFAFILRWTFRASEDTRAPCIVVFLFWGLWQVNAQDGQISLFLIATWLWAGSPMALERLNLKTTLLLAACSSKIFTFYPLLSLGISWKAIRTTFFIFIAIFLPLSLPALWATKDHSLFHLGQSYAQAALSGGHLLLDADVRGRSNQGLTGLCLRLLQIPREQTLADIFCCLIVGSLIAFGWHRLSRNMRFQDRFMGWIGLTPVIHPLPFWYSFVMAFPLASLSLSASLRAKKRTLTLASSLLGIAMIAILTQKTLGSLGTILEFYSVKSWGVLLCCLALKISQKN